MKKRLFVLFAMSAAAFGVIAVIGHAAKPIAAEQPKDAKADEDAILKNAGDFSDAFNKGDAKAIAAFFTEKGDFTDQGGTKLVGRAAIEKSFAEFFAENKGIQLRIEITGLRFTTPDVAIEDGTTAILHPDGLPPSRARYTNVHVKKDGKWYLDSVRSAAYSPPSNYEHLKSLEGLIGDWVDDVEKGEAARVSFSWTDNQNFIVSHFTTTIKGISIGGGTTWIGWDPNAKSIRSWMFETTGGFGQGTWAKADGKWVGKSSAVLPDGKKASSTNTVTRLDGDTISWEVTERTLDGKPLPDIKAVKMKRAK